MEEEQEEIHDIVIVGGGICGLATALALHMKGMRSLVLERSERLRAEGAAITVQLNGWRALDQLKVGNALRTKSVRLTGLLHQFVDKNRTDIMPLRYEGRGLKRSDLVETLANSLPSGAIRFGCHIVSISLDPVTSFPVLSSSDGSAIRTKVLIGCDGAHSVVAKYLGLKDPKFFPLRITRGFTNYADGSPFGNHFLRRRGNNGFFGRVPITDNLVHFFVGHLHPSEDSEMFKDPELIKNFMLKTLEEFPSEIVEMAKQCDLVSLSLTRVCYRAPWHLISRNFQKGTVTVAGDAMHVMGPFLGQGGSAGLEDAVVLARCLSQAIPKDSVGLTSDSKLFEKVERAMRLYVKERCLRIIRLSTQSYLVGSLMTTTSWLKRSVYIAVLAVVFGGTSSLSHIHYDCGQL